MSNGEEVIWSKGVQRLWHSAEEASLGLEDMDRYLEWVEWLRKQLPHGHACWCFVVFIQLYSLLVVGRKGKRHQFILVPVWCYSSQLEDIPRQGERRWCVKLWNLCWLERISQCLDARSEKAEAVISFHLCREEDGQGAFKSIGSTVMGDLLRITHISYSKFWVQRPTQARLELLCFGS